MLATIRERAGPFEFKVTGVAYKNVKGRLTYRRARADKKRSRFLVRKRVAVRLISCLTSFEMYFAFVLRIDSSNFEHISKLVKREGRPTAILTLSSKQSAFCLLAHL